MNPRRHCKSGECHQRGHHSDFAASRESAEEHECWSSGSCKRCDCQQNRDSEAGNQCEGTVSGPLREGAGCTNASEEAEEKKRSAVLQDDLIAGGEDSSCSSRGARGMSNSREETFLFSVERVGVRAPQIASGLAACAELSVPLKEVTWSLLEEITRNPVDLGIKTGEGAVASWSFVAVLMCCHEAVCV